MYYLIDHAGVTDQEIPALRTALERFDEVDFPLRRERRRLMQSLRGAGQAGADPVDDPRAEELLAQMLSGERARLEATELLVQALSQSFSPLRQLKIIMGLRKFEEDFRRRQERSRDGRRERGPRR